MADAGALQSRLERHFANLSRQRSAGVVFALESGLTPDEIDEVRDVVRQTVALRRQRDANWLVWVVHAAEVAYDFAGDEYWPRLRRATPGWEPSLRPWLRATYQRFSREYGGPQPTGAWARAFSIICWPITNAVLPTDLQRHLARAMYTARHGLAARLGDVTTLGEYIAANSWEGSDRFAQLKEQPVLLGQIARALLPPQDESDTLLLPSTLHRIAVDLERHREAATWLRGARRSADSQRFRPRGVSHRHLPEPEPIETARVRAAARLSRPRLVLRASRDDKAAADLWLALPNLSSVASASDEVRAALAASRCSVPGSDKPVAPGRLLFDSQLMRLSRWPEPGAALLRLNGLAAGLEAALLDEWAAPDPPALFVRRADQSATLMSGYQVACGKTYFVATSKLVGGFPAVPTTFDGIHLHCLDLPNEWSRELARDVRAIGLGLVHGSDIWPAGVPPVFWDGSSAEWLSGDLPMLGIRSDHGLRSVELAVDGEKPISKDGISPGDIVYVELPELGLGIHKATLREFPQGGSATETVLWLTVREPSAVVDVVGPVRMWVEPHSRSLDELWASQCSVVLAGPSSKADLTVELAVNAVLPPLGVWTSEIDVPLDASQWRSLWRDEITQSEEVTEAYDQSRFCRVEVNAHRYGKYGLEFERNLPVLRWRLSRESATVQLRLTDDSDDDLQTRVGYASFGDPLAQFLPVEMDIEGETSADPGGGLYVATNGPNSSLIIAPTGTRRLRGFDQLDAHPTVAKVDRSEGGLLAALERLSIWCRAPLPAFPVERFRRAQAVRAIHRNVVGAIGGAAWATAEQSFTDADDDRERGYWLERLRQQLKHPKESRSSQVTNWLVREAPEALMLPTKRRVELFAEALQHAPMSLNPSWPRVVQRHGEQTVTWVAEWLLRLATDPAVEAWAGSDTSCGAALALEVPNLVKVARYLGLASDSLSYSPGYPPLFDFWVWDA